MCCVVVWLIARKSPFQMSHIGMRTVPRPTGMSFPRTDSLTRMLLRGAVCCACGVGFLEKIPTLVLEEREIPAIAARDESFGRCVSENDSAAANGVNDGLRPGDDDCAVVIYREGWLAVQDQIAGLHV